MNTNTAYEPAARSSFDEQARPKDIQRSIDGKPLWRKAFLITFWVLQIIICIVGWGFGAFSLVVKSYSEDDKSQTALDVAAGIYISWSSVCFILIVTEIVMFSQRNLKPWFEVTSSSIKTALWLVFFLIAIHDAAVYGLAGISLYMYGVFTILFLTPLTYSARVLHQQRKSARVPVVSSVV